MDGVETAVALAETARVNRKNRSSHEPQTARGPQHVRCDRPHLACDSGVRYCRRTVSTITGSGWSRQERDRFWSIVRGRMAELGRDQADLAEVLVIDRSSATRRLMPGGVMAQPTASEVRALLDWLQLDEARARELAALAGASARPRQEKRSVRWIPAAGMLVLLVLGAIALRQPGGDGPNARITGIATEGERTVVHGIARGLGDGKRLWLMRHDERGYQPLAQTVPDSPNGEWTGTLASNSSESIALVLAGPESDRRFADALSGQQQASFAALPADAVVLDSR